MKFEKYEFDVTWLVKSEIHHDARGQFRETFRKDLFQDASGLNFDVIQVNASISSKGVLRGIHYSVSALGQAKWVSCLKGEINDYIVDLRPKSSTFGQWKSITLSEANGLSLIIPTGIGHAFETKTEGSIVSYSLSSAYDPVSEMTISPLDPTINIKWLNADPLISDRDRLAPTLEKQIVLGNMPSDNLHL